MVKNNIHQKTKKSITILISLFLFVLSLSSVLAPADFGYTLSTHDVSISDQGILSVHVVLLLRGDSVRFQNNDDQPHTLIRVNGDQGQERIIIQPGASQELNFPDPTIAELRYAVDQQNNPQQIIIRVSPLTIPDAPAGKTRTAVLIRENKFLPTELTITRGDGIVFLNLDHVSHRVSSRLLPRFPELRPFPGLSETFFITKSGGVFILDDQEDREGESTFTLSLAEPDTFFPRLLSFVKTKATGLIRTLTRFLRPPEELSEDELSKIPALRSFDRFYLAQNGDKTIIGFTQSRNLRGPNAKMKVYYKNIDFDICATLLEFRRQHTISEDDLQCIHRNNQYEVTASPVVYDQYWQDFTSKIRLNNPPRP